MIEHFTLNIKMILLCLEGSLWPPLSKPSYKCFQLGYSTIKRKAFIKSCNCVSTFLININETFFFFFAFFNCYFFKIKVILIIFFVKFTVIKITSFIKWVNNFSIKFVFFSLTSTQSFLSIFEKMWKYFSQIMLVVSQLIPGLNIYFIICLKYYQKVCI